MSFQRELSFTTADGEWSNADNCAQTPKTIRCVRCSPFVRCGQVCAYRNRPLTKSLVSPIYDHSLQSGHAISKTIIDKHNNVSQLRWLESLHIFKTKHSSNDDLPVPVRLPLTHRLTPSSVGWQRSFPVPEKMTYMH